MHHPGEGGVGSPLPRVEQCLVVGEQSPRPVPKRGVGILGTFDQRRGDLVLHPAVTQDIGNDLLHLIGNRPSFIGEVDQIWLGSAPLGEILELAVERLDLLLEVDADPFGIAVELRGDPLETTGDTDHRPTGCHVVRAPQPP